MLWRWHINDYCTFTVNIDGTVAIETIVNDTTQKVMITRQEWLEFLAKYHSILFAGFQ